MPDSIKKGDWSKPMAGLMTQEETLQVMPKRQKLYIGVPSEAHTDESRVPLAPSAVRNLSGQGHRVIIESGAGYLSHFTDHDYSEAGGEIASDKREVYKAHTILKTAPLSAVEAEMLGQNQVIISPLTIPYATAEVLEILKKKKIIAIATEYLKDADGSFPMVRSMSEIAGISVISIASSLMSTARDGIGKLLGGISGVPPAKVVILGAGIVAEYASRAALGLGARVHIYDNSMYKLLRVQNAIGQQLYTSTINLVDLQHDLSTADVVIGAIHSATGRAPIIVSEEMVMSMKTGSVIIDVSIDQGGCFETSEVTSLERPTFQRHGVIHYCVPNITSRYPQTSSKAISNILQPLLTAAASHGGMENLIAQRAGLRHGVYTYHGCLTNEYLARRFQMKYTDLDLIIPSVF